MRTRASRFLMRLLHSTRPSCCFQASPPSSCSRTSTPGRVCRGRPACRRSRYDPAWCRLGARGGGSSSSCGACVQTRTKTIRQRQPPRMRGRSWHGDAAGVFRPILFEARPDKGARSRCSSVDRRLLPTHPGRHQTRRTAWPRAQHVHLRSPASNAPNRLARRRRLPRCGLSDRQ